MAPVCQGAKPAFEQTKTVKLTKRPDHVEMSLDGRVVATADRKLITTTVLATGKQQSWSEKNRIVDLAIDGLFDVVYLSTLTTTRIPH